MPSNFTANYNLSQWERSDQVKMEDFNADNAKIDGALAGKAEQSALNALSQTVSGHTAALSKKGNCRIYFSSYTGTGKYGSSNPSRHNFPGRPLFVMIAMGDMMTIALQGMSSAYWFRSGSFSPVEVSWPGNAMQWYGRSDTDQMNYSNTQYNIMALISMD